MIEPNDTSGLPYPYGTGRLRPDWHSRKAHAVALGAAGAVAIALMSRPSLALAGFDDVALRVLLPAFLAVVLALAPRPATRLGQIAKDFTAVSLIAAILAADHIPLLIASFPLLLAASALCSRTALARRLWPEAI